MTNLSPAAQMTDQHPITPPPELVSDWCRQWARENDDGPTCVYDIATQAARWGGDQELEACCHEVQGMYGGGSWLRATRRPKPPSLKEQALEQYAHIERILRDHGYVPAGCVMEALEALPDD